MTKTYTVLVEHDGDDLVIPIPPEIIASLDLHIGDELEWWREAKSVVLRKKT